MVRSNPILPSEPLALEPNLIAAAVIAEELDNHKEANGHTTPRNASKVKRRLDNRHFGRSESRHSDEHRHRERSRHSDEHKRVDRHSEEHADRGHYSPRRDDKAQGRFAGHRDEDRDTKRYRVDEQAAVAEEGGQSSYYTHGRPIRDEQKNGMQPSSVLGIFGMSKFTNEEALREMFGDFGPVTKVQIIRDQNMGHSRGYAFINMANVADAQKARDALNDTMVHDRRVRVDFSFTSRPHSPTPGKYRGQDTAARRQEYRPRRRANSRDRRRDQERHYAPSRGAWGRSSRSPGHRRPSPARRRAASPGGEYQPPPMSHGAPPPMLASRSSYMSYRSSHTDHGRSEYGGHSRSRSPHRRPAHPQHPDYHHGRSHSRNRYSRNEHRHDAYDRHY